VLPGALGADLGKQERTASRQTATGIPTAQQRDRDGPYRWTGAGGSADADLTERSSRGNSTLQRIPTGPVGALPGERRVLEHHSTPNPAEPAGLLRTRVVGAGGALAGPGPEHRRLFRISSSFRVEVLFQESPQSLFTGQRPINEIPNTLNPDQTPLHEAPACPRPNRRNRAAEYQCHRLREAPERASERV